MARRRPTDARQAGACPLSALSGLHGLVQLGQSYQPVSNQPVKHRVAMSANRPPARPALQPPVSTQQR